MVEPLAFHREAALWVDRLALQAFLRSCMVNGEGKPFAVLTDAETRQFDLLIERYARLCGPSRA